MHSLIKTTSLNFDWIASSCMHAVGFDSYLSLLSASTEDMLPPGFPSIDMGPQLKVVERTRTATMLCAASGFPDPVISWFKDFLPVEPSASKGRIKLLRSGEPRHCGLYLLLLCFSCRNGIDSWSMMTLFLHVTCDMCWWTRKQVANGCWTLE